MFGSHLSIAGSMLHALDEAQQLSLDTVQVFTKNQQQWKAKPLDPGVISDWRARVNHLGWQGRTVSHASYLANLASPDDELWAKSVALMHDEIDRCEALGIAFLVHHPGAFTTGTLDGGLSRIARAYEQLFRETRGYSTVCCLEGTAGAGSTIGGPFEDLADLRRRILQQVTEPHRVGFCLDTCHLHAAGHDMSSAACAAAVLDRFDELCGLTNLRCLHLNDSKGALGSHLDRHEHIGEGHVGRGTSGKPAPAHELRRSGFAAVVNHPALVGVPKILETPKGDTPDGTPWDTINLARLKSLVTSSIAATYPAPSLPPPPPSPAVKPRQTPAKSKPSNVKPSTRSASSSPKPKRARTPKG